MPIYEYECRKCGVFEYSQSISDDPLKRCPKCRSSVQKLLSASAFHLKGGGWYADGYEKKGGDSSSSRSAGSDTSSSSNGSGASGKSAKAAKSETSGKAATSSKSSGSKSTGKSGGSAGSST